jgi:hypothetical protein
MPDDAPGAVVACCARYVHGDGTHDLDCSTLAPARKPKRKKSTSPTARTLAECRKRGLIAQVVEKWNPHARIRQDLFGVIDLLAILPPSNLGPGSILGIQACAGGDHATRRDKILAEPRAAAWIRSGGRLELWSWSKRGDRGARKLWTLRVEAFTAESWSAA